MNNATHGVCVANIWGMMSKSFVSAVDDECASDLAEIFKILGDRTRIKMLCLLIENAELTVSAIAGKLGMGQSAISHQLRILRAARLVKFHKDGKEVRYSLDDEHVLTLLGQGLEHVLHK